MPGEGPVILAIGGSRRPGNNTDKALRLAVEELTAGGGRVDWVRLGELRLPLPGEPSDSPDPGNLQRKVLASDGILIATPEYHGSISSTLKLAIDNLGFPSTLEGKTIAILGVAMGPEGAKNALAHLRHILTHIGGKVIPEETSIGSVHKKFDEGGRCLEPGAEAGIRRVARALLASAGAGARKAER
ncbi:MAG: NAD(P)H-dependent oxidoreductase [Candidatus Tectomicrobia bacterium]|nr:NAD(P)H-dependent oxidoreductase [Candidatus Tectomicrobia bacterium]